MLLFKVTTHAIKAIAHMSGVFQRDVTRIELKEMVSVLSVPKKSMSIKKDDWVRCKKGLYAGDLGQVHFFDDAQQEAVVKLIPRLSIEEGSRFDEEESGGRKNRGKDNRPVNIFFIFHQGDL